MAEVEIISHWHQLIDGFQHSSKAFYETLEKAVGAKQIPDAHLSRVEFSEGGLLSAKRQYLRVKRREHTFDICAAPFGSGFFVSWWLFAPPGCLTEVPILGVLVRLFVKPMTYWTLDTAYMFQDAVHHAVLEVIDGLTSAKGIRALSELERKPILREFFGRS